MTLVHGFELLQDATITELNTRARLWRHAATGAQLLSLENEDENKCFSINFLNAMTFPDKTLYPVASTNLKDFYNLIDVYLDAVLHPLISPYTLMQEGWHYELETADGEISYKVVVFNEMKKY